MTEQESQCVGNYDAYKTDRPGKRYDTTDHQRGSDEEATPNDRDIDTTTERHFIAEGEQIEIARITPGDDNPDEDQG